MKAAFIIFAILQPAFPIQLLPEYHQNSTWIFCEILENIISHHFTDYRFLPVIVNINHNEVVTSILKLLNSDNQIPILLSTNRIECDPNDMSFYHKSHQFLLLEEDENSFNKSLKMLSSSPMWNSRARYLVVPTSMSNRAIKVVFEVSASRYINNIILVQEDRNINEGFNRTNVVYDIYTYSPFHEGKWSSRNSDFLLDQWKNGRYFRGIPLYPQKMVNLYGRSLRISMFHIPPFIIMNKTEHEVFLDGVEARIIFTAASKMNFTPIITTPTDGRKWGLFHENGTADGVVGDVFYRRADIGIASMVLNKNRFNFLDITNMYETACFTWVVPKASFYPKWMNIILPFSYEIWISVLISSISTIVVMIMMSDFHKITPEHISNVVLSVLSITCLLSVPHTPKSLRLRIVFIMYVLLCHIVMSAYVSSLVTYLTVPVHMKDIDNLEELLKSKLGYGGHRNYLSLLNSSDETIMKIMSKYIYYQEPMKLLDRIANERDFAMPYNKDPLTYVCVMKNYLGGRKRPLIHILSGCTRVFSIHALLNRDSPYLESFNTVVVQLTEAGIIKKWMFESARGANNAQTKGLEKGPDSTVAVITLDGLIGAFALLLTGLGFSIGLYVCDYILLFLKVKWNAKLRRK